jgi:preprotein translocase SecE subunit
MATDRPRPGSDTDDADLGDDDRIRDDDYERDFGAAEPPDPLGQAMPDVTEAHLAEAGAVPPHTPRPPRRGGGGGGGGEHHAHEHAPQKRKGIFGRATDFLRASYLELRRVQWPDRRQVGQGTAVTMGFVIVAGAYLGLLDAIWNPVVQWIL